MQSRLTVLLALPLIFCLMGTGSVHSQINTIVNGGFENAEAPAYWHKANAGGATLEWASDVYRSPQRSLKISKSSGSDAPMWESDNLARLNWNPVGGIPANIEMEVGGWVKTSGVNVNPASDDARITLSFWFFDASDALIFGQPVVIAVPQGQATSDWSEIKNSTAVVLPVDAARLVVQFKFGASATGTVWLDDIFLRNAPGAQGWLGDLYNGNFGVPANWFFWKGQMSEGVAGKGVVTITSEASHSGTYSLLVEDDGSNPDEVVAISDRNPIEPGRAYGISAWVKLAGVNTNEPFDVEKAVFFTLTYHTDAAGWAEISGQDFFVVDQSARERDWTLYSFTFTPPANATRLSVRARLQHQATGKTYWDDFRMYPVEVARKNLTLDESSRPAYWEGFHNGGQAVWTGKVYRSAERSLMLSKNAGSSADPIWLARQMAKLNWNPSGGVPANIEMEIGGWVKTENVNTNPANDAAKIQLRFKFFDASHNLIFGQPVVLDVPQTQASTEWTEIKNGSAVVLPVAADSMVIEFQMGPNASGTVYLDDVFMRNAPGAQGWLGDLYNGNFGVPEGWFFWKGQMSEGVAGKGIVTITAQYSYSGRYSLRVSDDAGNPDEVVAISDRNPVQPNTEYLVTARVKRVGTVLNPPPRDVEKAIFFTVTYHGNSPTGWDEKRGEDFFVIDQTTVDRDWTQYSFRLKTRADEHRLSIRARLQHQATGDTYWDEFHVVPIATPNANLSFDEAEVPAYWMKLNTDAATVEWATDQVRSPQRSLKISKVGGGGEPAWQTRANMAKLNWNPVTGTPANVEMEIGGWVKTENVNVNPGGASGEIQLLYSFYDKNGALIFGQPVVLNVPQAQPSTDWTEIKNPSPVVLPVDADSLVVTFKFGADATGTVWLDDLFLRNAPGAQGWLGDLFNANFGTPEGWFFWKGQMSEGVAGKGVVSLSRDYAHSGDYSLLVSDDAGNPDEVVLIGNRNSVQGNRVYQVSAWVKTVGVNTNVPFDVEQAIFFTVTYHKAGAGWAEVRGEDYFVIDQTVTDKDWSLYSFTLTTPAEANRMSIRGRMQHRATGRVYFDDFAVVEGQVTRVQGGRELPAAYALAQNYPNPFNPETRISYALPRDVHVTLAIFNALGQKVRTLVQANQPAGRHEIVWDGRNDDGQSVASGIYFYQLRTADAKLTRRMLLMR
ncbi:MAG: carbohydrate binding domain-containing protein [candidate division KSB1 bacterium]|nr:carbohydrate binding domain-containing protein [candidate division KSB1 bacterium]MDZ7273515.1 carbohydrate binding domain-containing protein [candidate division KSB1 bacterium]MDZ7286894.1 carbohydrate binding domain-containing protein [candidate division KSB1 bacterium]MDZ7299753.1 carbohydrate binding domain-containing protein [candidate division KSB1 bacterium]MDZ7305692.1 carbohydrate binding domain-containing protein [candidate division KSB1 bacterium]